MSVLLSFDGQVNSHVSRAESLAREAIEMGRAFARSVGTGAALGFAEFQSQLSRIMNEIEVSLSSAALQSLEPTTEVVSYDGRSFKRLDDTEINRSYLDLRGSVGARAALFREIGVHNGRTIVPLELRAGIVEGKATPRAAAAIGHLAQALPSAEAQAICESIGVLPTSRSSAYRLANALGECWDARRAEAETTVLQALDIPAEATSVAVAIDRVTLPMAEPRELTEQEKRLADPPKNPTIIRGRQVYVGCLTLCDSNRKALHTIRYGWVPEDDSREMLEDALRHDLLFFLASRPDLKVAALGDGAVEVQHSLDRVTEGIEVHYRGVDFWHNAGYVNKAVEAVGGTSVQKKALLDTLRSQANGASSVLLTFLSWAFALELELKPDFKEQEGESGPMFQAANSDRETDDVLVLRLIAVDGKPVDEQSPVMNLLHARLGQACGRLAKDGSKLRVSGTISDRSKPPEFQDVPTELVEAIRYLWNHWERMQYADAITKRLPIGSGNVEASCKTLVSVRMKRSGSQWKDRGAQSILHLRSLATSSRWQPGINFILSTYQGDVQNAA